MQINQYIFGFDKYFVSQEKEKDILTLYLELDSRYDTKNSEIKFFIERINQSNFYIKGNFYPVNNEKLLFQNLIKQNYFQNKLHFLHESRQFVQDFNRIFKKENSKNKVSNEFYKANYSNRKNYLKKVTLKGYKNININFRKSKKKKILSI